MNAQIILNDKERIDKKEVKNLRKFSRKIAINLKEQGKENLF